ncbi:ectoine hydroxylase [Wenzhouxiangella sp. C33]|uniref:Ectoine hydroxylase n=2 Tax=Wenzhouxiangella limi TaxID=2707351 RepID=A0A845UYJ9_9GAMM|nr:ectoine hydroxylase [Wenzhouxiangella limi]
MATTTDLYPSRKSEPDEFFPRRDPTVYGTPDDGPLEQEQLDRYRRDGFLFFPGFFSGNELGQYRKELSRLCCDPDMAGREEVITEPDGEEVRSIFRVHHHSQLFDELSRHPRVLPMAEQLLGSPVYLHQSRINYKPGFKGKGFNWHSDFETWHAEDGMPAMRAVSCSVILTDNDMYNGPLMLIPGSHRYFIPCAGPTPDNHYRQSLRVQKLGVPDTDSLAHMIESGGIESAIGPAGSLLLFECNLLHGSNANMSPTPRSNAFFVYNSVFNTPDRPFGARHRRPGFLSNNESFAPLKTARAKHRTDLARETDSALRPA